MVEHAQLAVGADAPDPLDLAGEAGEVRRDVAGETGRCRGEPSAGVDLLECCALARGRHGGSRCERSVKAS